MTQNVQSATNSDLLTVAEVAVKFRVSKMTVYRLIKVGELKAIRIGRSFRIRVSDAEAIISSGD